MAALSSLVVFSLLLLGPGWVAVSEGGRTSLQAYLERAESAGIIDHQQAKRLLELSLIMNLAPLQSAPDTREQDSGSQQASPTPGPAGDGADSREAPQALPQPQDRRTSVFMNIYNHLTLLNVLYLSGAVIIMGSYSIFMTLAVERCSYGALSGIMLVQVVVSGGAGVSLWESDELAYAGGM